jgi:hypothetical protein
MSNFWKQLFGHGWVERNEIEALQAEMGGYEVSSAIRRRIETLSHRVDRNELVLEALFRVMQENNLVTEAALSELVARIDLEDGREDGRIGRERKSPTCENPDCGRPVNPRRSHCVFCGAPTSDEDASAENGPYRR